jgi:hypothetical protein
MGEFVLLPVAPWFTSFRGAFYAQLHSKRSRTIGRRHSFSTTTALVRATFHNPCLNMRVTESARGPTPQLHRSLSLLPLARHLGYGFLPVPWVYLATIAVAAGYPPGGCPHPSQRGVQPFRRREPAAGTAGADRTDPGFSRLAAER